jgi:hypothetical protein
MGVYVGYCMSCKKSQEILNAKLIQMQNGRTRVAGSCTAIGCLGKISKIIS